MSACLYVYHVPAGSRRGQLLDSLEQELQVVVIYPCGWWVLGTEPVSFARAACILDCWATSA